MAVHAGVEGGTLELARGAARAAHASWYALTQPARLRWHVSSTLVDPSGSETLAAFLAHADVVMGIHGYGRPSRPRDILVGGANRQLATHVAASLRASAPEFRVVDDLSDIPIELRGLHPRNPVNLTAGGGVQLELPPAARGASWLQSEAGGPCRPPSSVVEALAAAATTWLQGSYDGFGPPLC